MQNVVLPKPGGFGVTIVYTEQGTILNKCIIDKITITHFFLIIDTTTITFYKIILQNFLSILIIYRYILVDTNTL